jgi:predicted PurR-regulated permease PerM
VRTKVLTSIPAILGSTFSTISGVVEYLVLIPIYTFLLLMYRKLIVHFVIACFNTMYANSVTIMLGQTKFVIRSYIFGLLIEMLLVAIMTFIGLLLVGSQYALLLAFIVALLNLIPYLGMATSAIISIIVTISSNNPVTIIGVLIVLVCVHIIDSNILLPKIVGSKVKINALATIIGVVVGSELWGIPGMFLAVPVMAILKVLFESIGELHPWSILLGEDE